MKRTHAILLIILVVVVTAILTFMFYPRQAAGSDIIDTKEVAMDLTVGSDVGFNADRDAVHFGTLDNGGLGQRSINLTNNMNIPLVIELYISGNISDFISFSKNNIEVNPGEFKTVKVFASIPKNGIYGNYAGILRAVYRKK
ncbi:MAG: hypothetical protein ABIE94_03905 [archaeon]